MRREFGRGLGWYENVTVLVGGISLAMIGAASSVLVVQLDHADRNWFVFSIWPGEPSPLDQ
jgi:hypothetical protein